MSSAGDSFLPNTWVSIVFGEAVDRPVPGHAAEMEFDYSRLIVTDIAGKYYKARYGKEIWNESSLRASLLTDVEELDLSKLEFELSPHTLGTRDIKVCPTELAGTNDIFIKRPSVVALLSEETLEETKELFFQEARVAQALAEDPHPHLAAYFGIVVSAAGRLIGLAYRRYYPWYKSTGTRGKPYTMLSCFIDDVLFRRNVSRTPIRSPNFVADLVDAVEHMHALGYVHNDIKPDNIMFDDEGRPLLIDFDSARPIGAELGLKVGTPGYANGNATHSEERNDWYALKWTLNVVGIKWNVPEDILCEQCGRRKKHQILSPPMQRVVGRDGKYCKCRDLLGLGICGIRMP